MPNTVKVPLLGTMPKGAVIAGAGAAVIVTGYLIYKHNKQSTATGATAYGYGASAYGYGASAYGSGYPGYYGYGFDFQPYPTGSEYGYGAYGYGYYNPYTGQYIGPSPTQPPTTPPSPTHQTGKWITIGGRKAFWNPNKQTLGYWVGKGKKRHYVHTTV